MTRGSGLGDAATTEPKPCFVCGRKPTVGSFLLMDMRSRGWTALCPGKCYETDAYYDREDAVKEWNRWVESEGYVLDDDLWEEEGSVDEEYHGLPTKNTTGPHAARPL